MNIKDEWQAMLQVTQSKLRSTAVPILKCFVGKDLKQLLKIKVYENEQLGVRI